MQQEETLDDEEDQGFPMSPVSQKSPEPSKITAKRSLQLKQAPTKKQDQEAKKQRLEEAKKNTAPSATHWIDDTTRNKLSPWKVVARHTGTRRTHYHIIYISTAKNWGHNSKLGKTIRAKEHKCSQITCIQCLYEYITAGPGRDTLKEILIDGDKKVAICVLHSLGISNKQSKGRITSTDGRNHLFFDEGTTRNTVRRRLDYGTSTPHENLYDAEEYHDRGNDRTPFLTREETTLIQDIVSLSDRTRNWCFTYVKTKHLTKVKQ